MQSTWIARRSARRTGQGDAGWTLIELLIVISLIMTLASLALTQYRNSVVRAQEAALKSDLFLMRDAIDQVLRRQGQVSRLAGIAGERTVPAAAAAGSLHAIGRYMGDDAGRPGSWCDDERAGHLRREEWLGRHGHRREPVRRLVARCRRRQLTSATITTLNESPFVGTIVTVTIF